MQRRMMLLAAAGTLAGCAGADIERHAGEQPVLDLRTWFDGRVTGHGMFTDRGGQVVKRFVVVMNCSWQGDDGVLDEDFTYSDGTTQKRIWRVRRLADGRFTGRADDVVGEAIGQARGNALRWNYTLALDVDGKTWNVQMDDWMVLVDRNVLLNRTRMTKFGVHLGDVTLSFRKGT
ncbi:MAG: DUF3833 domain-containing protein [Comamonadaceae bacterium]|nr:MAG: DUF3833 domain-containing protein [Comamonadaceae bacterium]